MSATLSQSVAKGTVGELFHSWRRPSTNCTCTCAPVPLVGSRGRDLVSAPLHPPRQAITAQTEFLVPLLQQAPQASADMAQRLLPCEVADLDPEVIGQTLWESCRGPCWARRRQAMNMEKRPTMLGTTPTMLGTTPTMLGTAPTMLGTTHTVLDTDSLPSAVHIVARPMLPARPHQTNAP